MGNVQSTLEQKRSKSRFAISDSEGPTRTNKPFLFATEPKHKSRDVKMYHIHSITETMVGKTRSVAIVDLVHVCIDISSVKRDPTNRII